MKTLHAINAKVIDITYQMENVSVAIWTIASNAIIMMITLIKFVSNATMDFIHQMVNVKCANILELMEGYALFAQRMLAIIIEIYAGAKMVTKKVKIQIQFVFNVQLDAKNVKTLQNVLIVILIVKRMEITIVYVMEEVLVIIAHRTV